MNHCINGCFAISLVTTLPTPKFHWVVSHVVPFVRKFGTWGKLNEQPVESLHRKINEDIRRYKNVMNEQIIMERLTTNSCIRNAIFDENLAIDCLPTDNAIVEDDEYLDYMAL